MRVLSLSKGAIATSAFLVGLVFFVLASCAAAAAANFTLLAAPPTSHQPAGAKSPTPPLNVPAAQAPTTSAAPSAAPGIAIIPGDGMNLAIVDQVDPHYVVVKLTSPAHNWFAGTFTNLPTDNPVTIGLSMEGNDTGGNKADVSKWVGLAPVMTYADPTRYETYEWYAKDAQGRWVSGDPFKTRRERYAGTGKVPDQSAIPADLAGQFLSPDGKYWQPWREVDRADFTFRTGQYVFRIVQKFSRPEATVAMRIPYTYTYLETFIEHLLEDKAPGVYVDEIGRTPGQRMLQAIRVEDLDSTAAAADRKAVLVIAREHATEPAGSWALQGILTSLLTGTAASKQFRKDTTFIFIPIQDPDGSADSIFDRTTEWMRHAWDPKIPPEMFDYAHYITRFVNGGRSIDMSMVLHNVEANGCQNVEANECQNVFCPFIDARFPQATQDFSRGLYDALKVGGYAVPDVDSTKDRGWRMYFRLYGWCAMNYGSFDLAYEVNDRYPANRLTLERLQGIGTVIADRVGGWTAGPEGLSWHKHALEVLAKRDKEREAHFKEFGITENQRNEVDLLVYGY